MGLKNVKGELRRALSNGSAVFPISRLLLADALNELHELEANNERLRGENEALMARVSALGGAVPVDTSDLDAPNGPRAPERPEIMPIVNPENAES